MSSLFDRLTPHEQRIVRNGFRLSPELDAKIRRILAEQVSAPEAPAPAPEQVSATLALESARVARDESRAVATGERQRPPVATTESRRKGGLARAASLSAERRREIGRTAVAARWSRSRPETER